jgi:hypothetical protein
LESHFTLLLLAISTNAVATLLLPIYCSLLLQLVPLKAQWLNQLDSKQQKQEAAKIMTLNDEFNSFYYTIITDIQMNGFYA